MEDEAGTGSKEVRFFDGNADGAGNATATLGTETADMTYQVFADRTMSFGPATPGVFETSYGIIKADGSILATTDAVRGGISGDDVEFSVIVAKSTMAGTVGVPGTFIIGEAGFDPSNDFYVSRVLVTINAGATTGSWEILAHSNPAMVGNSGSLTIAFSNDGTFTYDNGTGVDYGIISPDGNIFALADATGGDADGVIIAIGVRISTSGTPDGIGDYVINQIGLDAPLTTPEIYTSRINLTNGIGTFDF